jgi:hypothetical protein
MFSTYDISIQPVKKKWYRSPVLAIGYIRLGKMILSQFDEGEYAQHELNLSFVKMGALEGEYKQKRPCCLYSLHTSFGKEVCSIVRNIPISRTDIPSSQHRGFLTKLSLLSSFRKGL